MTRRPGDDGFGWLYVTAAVLIVVFVYVSTRIQKWRQALADELRLATQPTVYVDRGRAFSRNGSRGGGDDAAVPLHVPRASAVLSIGNYSVHHDIGPVRVTQEDRHCVWNEVAHLRGALSDWVTVEPDTHGDSSVATAAITPPPPPPPPAATATDIDVKEEFAIFGLFDGHGGAGVVDRVASSGATGLVAQLYARLEANEREGARTRHSLALTPADIDDATSVRVRRCVEALFVDVDRQLYAAYSDASAAAAANRPHGGTTAVLWILHRPSGRVWTAHVGDSVAILYARTAPPPSPSPPSRESKNVSSAAAASTLSLRTTTKPASVGTTDTGAAAVATSASATGKVEARRVVFVTTDHSPSNAAEAQRVIRAGGTITPCGKISRVNGVIAMTRALGNFGLGRLKYRLGAVDHRYAPVSAVPSVTELRLVPGVEYTAILECDGVSDVMSAELVVAHHHDAHSLVEAALARGSTDNVSALSFDFVLS